MVGVGEAAGATDFTSARGAFFAAFVAPASNGEVEEAMRGRAVESRKLLFEVVRDCLVVDMTMAMMHEPGGRVLLCGARAVRRKV